MPKNKNDPWVLFEEASKELTDEFFEAVENIEDHPPQERKFD